MSRSLRPVSLFGCLLVLASILACGGSAPGLTGYADDVQAWVGHDGNVLVRTWGKPASTFTMPNGNTTYVYLNVKSIDAGKQLHCQESDNGKVASCWVSGAQVLDFECQTQFEVDANQRVVHASATGTACLVAHKPPNTTAPPSPPAEVTAPIVAPPAAPAPELSGPPATEAVAAAAVPAATAATLAESAAKPAPTAEERRAELKAKREAKKREREAKAQAKKEAQKKGG